MQLLEQKHEIELTENQRKVIESKYLRGELKTVDELFETVAKNIALAELLYLNIPDEKIFNGVNYHKKEIEIKGKKTQLILLHQNLNDHSSRNANFSKFIKNLYELAKENPWRDHVENVARKFYNLMARFEFLPNSPTLMNAGRTLQQLSACYVLPVEDSMEGIYTAIKNAAVIHQSGGGTGFSFSRLRPKGDIVRSTKGVASGPVEFIRVFDASTEAVKQGGTRRGANMGILRYDHPDIKEFLEVKKKPGMLENFNISVALDENFMRAYKEKRKFDLINPRNGEVVGQLDAVQFFEELVHSAWATGDPGIVFIDRINQTDSNPTPALGQIESTNPCGEQPLLPYEACNLGSINLSKFVKGRQIDWERLKECIWTCVHFLDNVIDVNNFPLPKIEFMAKSNRKIGLGVMGWAETLVMLGISYDSEDALKKAEEVMGFINDQALAASEALAKQRGPFPNWKGSIYDPDSKYFRGVAAEPRNATRTTIAPTGTIAIAAGLQGSGIEPFFAIVYTRYTADGIDAIKKGKKPAEKDILFEVNPLFRKIAEENNFFGLSEKELWDKINNNHKSIIGIEEIPIHIQRLFPTSHDVSPDMHIRMQCAFQKHVNNAVSKTVNLRNEATVDDVKRIYLLAYELGAKGITIYRDGCKQVQVLNISEKKKEPEPQKVLSKPRERPEIVSGTTYKIKTGYGNLYVTINTDEEGKPFEVFATTGKTGGVLAAKSEAICRLISLALRSGIDVNEIIDQLKGIRGPMPVWSKKGLVLSIPDAISKILADHVNRGQTSLAEFNGTSTPGKNSDIADIGLLPECPDCHNILEFKEGCAVCQFCGYSRCN